MSITKLYIEGNLETEVLTPILQGSPVLQCGGSKNALRPRTRAERQENNVPAGYLRDRDFDYDPPSDLTQPIVDCEENGTPIGWRWCRHEIENYLIEPVLVSKAMDWTIAEIEAAICAAGTKIRSYEAARWTVGVARRVLPPNYELRTRPELNEIALPQDLSRTTVNQWALNSIEAPRGRIASTTDPSAVQRSFEEFVVRFDNTFVADATNILVWFSGKDILAGMADWLQSKAIANPGVLRAAVRDWIIANPEEVLELLPEWDNLVKSLRA